MEFQLIETIYCDTLENLSNENKKLWKIFAEFDPENRDEIEDIKLRIQKWIWKYKDDIYILTDINYWPNGYENGAIFLNKKIVFWDHDGSITLNHDCPELLQTRLALFSYIKHIQSE